MKQKREKQNHGKNVSSALKIAKIKRKLSQFIFIETEIVSLKGKFQFNLKKKTRKKVKQFFFSCFKQKSEFYVGKKICIKPQHFLCFVDFVKEIRKKG